MYTKNIRRIIITTLALLLTPALHASIEELSKAIKNNNKARYEELLDNNPDLAKEKNEEGNYPLHLAAAQSNKDLCEKLLSLGANINDINAEKHTALYESITKVVIKEAQAIATFKHLLQKNAKIDLPGAISPLVHLFAFSKPEIAQLLIDNGANVDVTDEENVFTPLYLACIRNKYGLAEQIIEQGVDVHRKYKYGNTYLHFAGTRKIAELLVEQGAKVDEPNDKGQTPLFNADNVDIAKFLISQGASVHHQDTRGKTPLHCTKEASIAQLLIDKGAKVDAKDKEDKQPLHCAASLKDQDAATKVMETLIKNNADVNAKDKKGRAPIHYADSKDTINTLKENNATLNATDNEGRTALHHLFLDTEDRTGKSLRVAVHRDLLNAGVNPDISDNENRTYIEYLSHAPLSRQDITEIRTLHNNHPRTDPQNADPNNNNPSKKFPFKIVAITLLVISSLMAITLFIAKKITRQKQLQEKKEPQKDSFEASNTTPYTPSYRYRKVSRKEEHRTLVSAR